MQPIKLTIPGEFYDSQIYSGKLYLWEMDGSIRTINWDKLTNKFVVDDELKFVFHIAFSRNDFLYRDGIDFIQNDPQVSELIKNKLERLSKIDLTIESISDFEIKHQDNPMPFPHTDSLLYSDKMYIGSDKGVYEANCSDRNVNPVSSRPDKLWDGNVIDVSASYGSLALSSGSEGLFEYDLNEYHINNDNPQLISDLHTSKSNWTFWSIFGSSYVSSGYLAYFKKQETENGGFPVRTLNQIMDSESIFGSSNYSWGHQEKLCQIEEDSLQVQKFTPWEEDNEIDELGNLDLDINSVGPIISAETTLFGYIIEVPDGLLVLDSSLNDYYFDHEPVNWRVFPRSKHYINHLHIIYEDKLEIYSFVNDYYVDQEKKMSGLKLGNWMLP